MQEAGDEKNMELALKQIVQQVEEIINVLQVKYMHLKSSSLF